MLAITYLVTGAAALASMLGVALGAIDLEKYRLRDYSWVAVVGGIVFLHMSQWSLGPLLGAEIGPAPPPSIFSAFPFMLFCALSLQGTSFYVVNQIGPRKNLGYLMLPPMAVYLASTSYYAYKYMDLQLQMCDIFGQVLYTMHNMLWIVSVSNQVVLFSQLG